ncbi:PKD domain-containing protein [Carboxylicivirga sp. RSCT41]|uniref:PKD domain-containing protein n=1 Tax=Carboxylicivirga agarovorans TaxID=3417570 RepID=UPI003D34DBD4
MKKIIYTIAIALLTLTVACEDEKNPKDWSENLIDLDVTFTNVSDEIGIANSYAFENNTPGLSYIEWDFGNGTTVRQESGVFIYTENGTYEPKVTAVYGNRVNVETFDEINVQADDLIVVTDVSTPGVAGEENLRQLQINADASTVFTNSRWDFGDGVWVNTTDTDITVRYLDAGNYKVKFEAAVQEAILSAEATVTIENGDIQKQSIVFNDFDSNVFAGAWGEGNGDTKLLNDYNPDTNPYSFGGSNVLLMGKTGGWWTEARYGISSDFLDFSSEFSEVALRVYLEGSTVNIGGTDYNFNMPENERLLKVGLTTIDDWDGRVEVEHTITSTDTWVDLSFDFSSRDFSHSKIDANDIRHLWVMFSHGKGTSGVIYVDDIVLKKEYPGIKKP